MTDNTEREWPTFGDILSELNSLGHLSQVPEAQTTMAAVATAPAPTAAAPIAPAATAADSITFETAAPAADNDIVVPVLAPSTLDTSLLSSPSTDGDDSGFELAALEPLTPAPEVESLTDLPEITVPAVDVPDTGSVFDAPALQDPTEMEAPAFEPVEVEAPAFEPMAFEPVEVETPTLLSFEPTEMEAPAFEPVEVEAPAFEPMAFEPVEVETPTLLSFEPTEMEAPAFEAPAFADEAVSMDWAETPLADPLDQEPAFNADEPGTVMSFEDMTTQPLDGLTEAAPVDGQEFVSTDWSSGADELAVEAPAAEPVNFDSVATADAIESDLQDLFALDQSVSEDNFDAFVGGEVADDAPVADVVPLHPATDGEGETAFGLDAVFDPTAPVEDDPVQAWVGIQEDDDTREDPWAYMRPDEAEDVKGGFWSNRPKFFGGNERKAKKAARQQAAAAQEMRSNQAGPTCPNCSEIGQIDLDDPIGGKIHASCQNCGHVWSQASDAELRTESA